MSSDQEAAPAVLAVVCPYCERIVTATVHGWTTEGERDYEVVLLSCNECGSALLYLRELEWHSPTSVKLILTKRLWPDTGRVMSAAIPSPLREEYEQARLCFEAHAYTATAVMVRRTLEGVCADNNITERILARPLEKMHTSGLIDERLFEWTQALRVLGNEGAHFTGRQVSREDAEDALALAEALLDYMYVLTIKFRKFQARRKQRDPTVESAS